MGNKLFLDGEPPNPFPPLSLPNHKALMIYLPFTWKESLCWKGEEKDYARRKRTSTACKKKIGTVELWYM